MSNCYCSVLSVLLAAVPFPAFAELVAVQPTSQVVYGPFTDQIVISSAADLYAFEFDLGFNPTVLQAISIVEGPFLQSGGPTFFLPGAIDNTFGTIAFTADTLLGPGSGVSGSGVLATVTFAPIASGSSAINILNPLFLDSTGAGIAVTTRSGAVTSSVPEPGAIFLFGTVCATMLASSKLRRRMGSPHFATRYRRRHQP